MYVYVIYSTILSILFIYLCIRDLCNDDSHMYLFTIYL